MNSEMFLFDTDIITNFFKKKPSVKLIERIQTLKYEEQYISSITISEIVYGALKSHQPQFHLDNLRKILLPSVQVLTFDTNAAFVYGELRATLEKKGKVISHTDMQIASIALANQLILVTGNIRHFSRVPKLRVENWL